MIYKFQKRLPQPLKRFISIDTVIIISLSFLWVLFFWRLLTPELATRVQFEEGDFNLLFYPATHYQAERIWEGGFPFWNPYNYGGEPFFANIHWALFYPARLIAILLAGPGNWSLEAFQFEVAAHYWIASVLMYLFLHVLLKHRIAALAGSLLFSYGGYLVSFPMLQPSILETIIWLPLILAGIHLSITRENWRVGGWLLAGLGLGVSFLAGHPQTYLQVSYMTLAFLVFDARHHGKSWRQVLTLSALVFGFNIGIAAVQLLPAVEFVRLSHRINIYSYAQKATGFPPAELLHIIWPQPGWIRTPLYVGVAGLVLGIGAMIRRKSENFFWMMTAMITLLLSIGSSSILFDFTYIFVPGVSIFRQQERIFGLVAFALAVLAAYQVKWLLSLPKSDELSDEEKGFKWLTQGHLIFVSSVLAYLIFDGFARDGLLPGEAIAQMVTFVFLMSLLFNVWYVWQRGDDGPEWRVGGLLAAVIVIDLFTAGTRLQNFVPASGESRIPPPSELERISTPETVTWHVDGHGGVQGYGTLFHVPDIYGIGPLSLESVEQILNLHPLHHWEILSVRYITLGEGNPLVMDAPYETIGIYPSYFAENYVLYELLDPRPFAHLVFHHISVNSRADAYDVISGDVNLRESAVVTGPLPFDLPGARPPDDGDILSYNMPAPEQIEIQVTTPDNALLTLPIPLYPGWYAMLDGDAVDIIDTYGGLMGIAVPAGEHQIKLQFIPVSAISGGIITLLTGIGGGLLVLFEVRWRKMGESTGR